MSPLLSWLKSLWTRWRLRLAGHRFLCDVCRYNYRDACLRPERPNAVNCPDFKMR